MRYRSADGLMTSVDPAAVALWDEIGTRMEREQKQWERILRGYGVVAAHPDDGWVKRDRDPQQVHFAYPAFLDRAPQVGDLIALGSAHHHGKFDRDPKGKRGFWRYRIGRVVAVEQGATKVLTYYSFEDTGVRFTDDGPRLAVRKRWWQR
jgi:hypothetical protein